MFGCVKGFVNRDSWQIHVISQFELNNFDLIYKPIYCRYSVITNDANSEAKKPIPK